MSDLTQELIAGMALAEECGTMALDLQLRGNDALCAREKPDGEGPVTVADTRVNARIVEALATKFPNDGLLAEESPSGIFPADAKRLWIIDPIDGTRDFARGEPSWAIHIGLCIDGQPVLGIVAEPAAGRISWGITKGPDRGAWCRTLGTTVALKASNLEPRLVMSKSHHSERTPQAAQCLGIPPERQHKMGSVGVKANALARGFAQYYVHPVAGTKLWDSCAPQALLIAAGGSFTDLHGADLNYAPHALVNRRGLLATIGVDHRHVVERLAPLAEIWFPRAG